MAMKPTRFEGLAMTMTWLLVALMSISALAGCATMKKKFIRKKPERQVRPVIYTEEKFVKQYSNKYYYTTHFNNWKTWQDELLNSMTANDKRDERAMQEVLINLEKMQNYLAEPKKTELSRQAADVHKAADAMEAGGSLSDASIRLKLERTRRIINGGFYTDKVKDFIVPDTVDLGPAEAAPGAAPAPEKAESPEKTAS